MAAGRNGGGPEVIDQAVQIREEWGLPLAVRLNGFTGKF